MALRLKENLTLSKECFKMILEGDNSIKPLKGNINLKELFSFYQDEKSLLWLIQHLLKINKHFSSIKGDNFLSALDYLFDTLISTVHHNELGIIFTKFSKDNSMPSLLLKAKIALKLDEIDKINVCVYGFLIHGVWNPSTAKSFVFLYTKFIANGCEPYKSTKEKDYQNLIENLDQIEHLGLTLPLCFPPEKSIPLPSKNIHCFVNRVIALLEVSPKQKENNCFIEIQKTIVSYFKIYTIGMIEKGALKTEWELVFNQCVCLIPYLNKEEKNDLGSVTLRIMILMGLMESNLDRFNKFRDVYLQGKNNEEIAQFYQDLFEHMVWFINRPDQTQEYITKQIESNSMEISKKTKKINVSTGSFKKFEIAERKLHNWIVDREESAEQDSIKNNFKHVLEAKLKDIFIDTKKIIIDLIKNKADPMLCLELALQWTFIQFRFKNKEVLPQIREVTKVLIEESKSLNKEDFLSLVFISNVLYKELEKENIKQIDNFENEFLKKTSKHDIKNYSFVLFNNLSIIGNSFSSIFAHELLKEHLESSVSSICGWENNMGFSWKNRCQNESALAMRMIYFYATQAYLLSEKNLVEAHTFGVVCMQMITSFFSIYISTIETKEEGDKSYEASFLAGLKILIDKIYLHLMRSYRVQPNKDLLYSARSNALAKTYYKWLNCFFTSCTAKQAALNPIYQPIELHGKEICTVFRNIVVLKEVYLDQKRWKQALIDWYNLPKLLPIANNKKVLKMVSEYFDECLLEAKIDKQDLQDKK